MALTNERIQKIADVIEPKLRAANKPLHWFQGPIHIPSEELTVQVELQNTTIQVTWKQEKFSLPSTKEIEIDTLLQYVQLELIKRLRS